MSLRHRPVRLAVAALAGAMLAAVALTPPTSAAEVTGAQQLRVVTANLGFRGPAAVREDWKIIGPNADIVFVQEAKYVRLRDILGDGWAVRQDTSSEDRQGSAVVIRESVVQYIGDLWLKKGTDAHSCGIMTRWIARVGMRLNNGRWLRTASLHMPPARCQLGPGGPYDTMADSVVEFANMESFMTVLGADWNKVVDDDPNNIGGRTGLKPRGPDSGLRIDGFYVSAAISTWNLHKLPETGSDHRPVQMTISVPAP